MALYIISIYLLRNPIPLKARIMIRSLILSHSEVSATFFQSLTSYSVDKTNKQISWGKKNLFFHTCLYLENKILPAELQIAKTSFIRLFDIVQQLIAQDQKKFR